MKNLSLSLCCGRDVETLLYWQFAPEGREESKGGQGSHVGDEITLYSRTRRTARVRRPRRYRLPSWDAMGSWRPVGRHGVLRAVGLSHNQPAAHRVGQHRNHQPAAILAATRATAHAGHRAGHRMHRRTLRLARPQPAHEAARRHMGRAALGDELVVHLPRCFLFRRAGRSLAAHPLLVARHRRAVLPRLAGRAAGRPQNGREAHHHAQCHADRRPLVGAGDGAAVQPAGRPEPRVLRHRHPRVLAAYRRMAGVRVALAHAGSPEERAPYEAGAQRPGRRGNRRARRPAGPHRVRGRLLAVPLPRRHPAGLRAHRRRHRGDGASCEPARALRRNEAACMDRPAFVRHLLVALPAVPAHEPAQLHGRDAVVDVSRAGGRRVRLRRVLVPLRWPPCARGPSERS